MLGNIVSIFILGILAFLIHNVISTYLSGEEISLGQAIRELKERQVSFRNSLEM